MKKMIFLMLVFFLGVSASMNAQVAIGTGTGADGGPVAGAVLELDGAQGGLLLPKATLDHTTFIPVAWGTSSLPAGVIVYNLGSAGLDAGVYVWDGSQWLAGTSGSTVTPEEVLGVVLNFSTLSFDAAGVGDHTITATVNPETAEPKTITWSGDKKGVFNYDATSTSGVAVSITATEAAAGEPSVSTTLYASANGHQTPLTVTRAAGAPVTPPPTGGTALSGGVYQDRTAESVGTGAFDASTWTLVAGKKLYVATTDILTPASDGWLSAKNACTNQGDDWRLPNLAELKYIYANISSLSGFTTSKSYWSSTEYSTTGGTNAWFVSFSNGISSIINKTNTNGYARCVRSIDI
jgi:hypothetical protein